MINRKTQQEKILKVMASDPGRWWLPQDFMSDDLGSDFVGYEASARLSELAKDGKVESRRSGKYLARRLILAETPDASPKCWNCRLVGVLAWFPEHGENRQRLCLRCIDQKRAVAKL